MNSNNSVASHFNNNPNPSAEYVEALETANEASRVFAAVQKAYRARQADDATFLAARKVMDAANRIFDAAWDKENARCNCNGASRDCLVHGDGN